MKPIIKDQYLYFTLKNMIAQSIHLKRLLAEPILTDDKRLPCEIIKFEDVGFMAEQMIADSYTIKL